MQMLNPDRQEHQRGLTISLKRPSNLPVNSRQPGTNQHNQVFVKKGS